MTFDTNEAMDRLRDASPFKTSDSSVTISHEELDALQASIPMAPGDPPRKRRWASLSIPKRTAIIAVVVGVVGTGGGLAAAASLSTPSSPPVSNPPLYAIAPISKPLYSEPQRKVIVANLRKLASCMRSHGFPTFPEPKPNYGNGKVPDFQMGGGPNGGNLDITTPRFRTALNGCSVGMQKVPGNLGAKAFPTTP
jgi:hypothetical protein